MAGFNLKPKQFKSWSNSRWNDYYKCPAYAYYKHTMKLPEPKHPAMARGIVIAGIEEGFFKGTTANVNLPEEKPKVKKITPAVLKEFIHPNVVGDLIEAKKQKTLFVEQNWGFDKTWSEVDYFDWNNCWLRVKVDFGWQSDDMVVHLRDNKTGKYSEYDVQKYLEQLELYKSSAVNRFPTASGFTSQLIFTDLGIRYPAEPTETSVAEAKKGQKDWDKRVKPMFADTRFDPKPGRYCSWCNFSKAKGGPCKF